MNQTPNQQLTLSEMQKALSLHVWKNGHLREEIIKNPKETIERDLNVKFDDHIKINIVNQTDPNQVTFVLPYDIHKVAGQQLDDSQLEQIAGGGNLGKIGGIIGNVLGTSLQLGGRIIGLQLPDTGLGQKLGSAVGARIKT